MNTPTSVEFRLGELRSVRTKSRGKEVGHADIVIRVPLGEDFEAAIPFLAFLQNAEHPVALRVSQVQAKFGDDPKDWGPRGMDAPDN